MNIHDEKGNLSSELSQHPFTVLQRDQQINRVINMINNFFHRMIDLILFVIIIMRLNDNQMWIAA